MQKDHSSTQIDVIFTMQQVKLLLEPDQFY